MNTLSYKTISVNKETATKEWVVIDATDQIVGRLCSKVAKLLRGKYKPNFTPHVDCGDNVIIINAAKVRFTGKKETDKVYTRYTGYPVVSVSTLLPISVLARTVSTRLFATLSRVCSPRVLSAAHCSTTSMYMRAQSTSTRLRSQSQSILTSINNRN